MAASLLRGLNLLLGLNAGNSEKSSDSLKCYFNLKRLPKFSRSILICE